MNEFDYYGIGLELCSSNSILSVYKNGGVEIIPNKYGEKSTPSLIVFTQDGECILGEEANYFLIQNYHKTINELEYSESYNNENNISELPLKINIKDLHYFKKINININGMIKTYTNIELYSFFIKKMISIGENYLNQKITKLVIGCSIYYYENQNVLIENACELLKLDLLEIIPAYKSAVLAYQNINIINKNQSKNILIFDLEENYLNISIIEIGENGYIQILNAENENQINGNNFNISLENYIKKYKIKNEENNNEISQKLKFHCQNIKNKLCIDNKTVLCISEFDKKAIIEEITREEFEIACQNEFEKLEKILKKIIWNYYFTKIIFNEIILVGSSTKIPKIKSILEKLFPNYDIYDIIDPEEIISYGASLMAEQLINNGYHLTDNFISDNIIPLSLGFNIENTQYEKFNIIIKKGSIYPIFSNNEYYLDYNNQKEIIINIYEGDKINCKNNILIGKINFSKFPIDCKKIKFEIYFELFYDYTLKIYTKADYGEEYSLFIKNDGYKISSEYINGLKLENKNNIQKLSNYTLIQDNDFSNLRSSLKNCISTYEICENKSDKIYCLKIYNDILVYFINLFHKDLENETKLKKYYLYSKILLISCAKL